GEKFPISWDPDPIGDGDWEVNRFPEGGWDGMGRMRALEQETRDLDMENKHIKVLKSSYGVTTPQELHDVYISTLTMEQYLALIQDNIRLGVIKPEIGNDVEFEINSQFMKELRRNLFTGIDDEDAHEHVRRVLEIAYLFLNHGVTHDVKMLRVFPITLTRATSIWEKRLTPGVIITWDLLEKAFIEQYCPPFKTARKLEEI
ncbi:hypothetical protein Tco_0839347, partial [Tanacetum coccineum]